MTDKNDIAVFIKSAMLSCAEAFAMEIAGSLEYDIGRDLTDAEHKQVTDAVSGLLHTAEQLEAERQRADLATRQNEGINNNLRRRAVRAEAKLAALKGDQDPVGIWRIQEVTGEEGEISRTEFLSVSEGVSIHKDAKLFTAPQNPFVLPQRYASASLAGQGITVKDTGGDLLDRLQVIAAIEAAGGIVKDGE